MTRPNHVLYNDLLKRMEETSAVSRNVLARVLVRVMIGAPHNVARADIARGSMLHKPSMLNQSAVSKAVAVLEKQKLITGYPARPDDQRPGRPVIPVRLGGGGWALMGIKVILDEQNRPVRLHGVVTDFRVVDREVDILAEDDLDLGPGAAFGELPDAIEQLHGKLLAEVHGHRELFGLGVEVPSHVHEGKVFGVRAGGTPEGSYDLLAELQGRFTTVTTIADGEDPETVSLPVVIDNDVNVLAVRQTYRPHPESNVALVAVFENGIGASLIVEGHVYRGGGGLAAEPGHHTVNGLPVYADPVAEGFGAPCYCGKPGHVDCYVPRRIEAELNAVVDEDEEITLAEAARRPAIDDAGEPTAEGLIFYAAGRALGQGVASIVNVVDPARIMLVLPAELALVNEVETGPRTLNADGRAQPGTAGARYLEGVEEAVTYYSFSTGARDARSGEGHLTVQVLDPQQAVREGAICAAARALDAFVMHARGRDRCDPPQFA